MVVVAMVVVAAKEGKKKAQSTWKEAESSSKHGPTLDLPSAAPPNRHATWYANVTATLQPFLSLTSHLKRVSSHVPPAKTLQTGKIE